MPNLVERMIRTALAPLIRGLGLGLGLRRSTALDNERETIQSAHRSMSEQRARLEALTVRAELVLRDVPTSPGAGAKTIAKSRVQAQPQAQSQAQSQAQQQQQATKRVKSK